jgi:hypothetical protein
MLHAYELGLLEDPDRQAMEIHLIDCESCFRRLRGFSAPASLLRRDPQTRSHVSEWTADVMGTHADNKRRGLSEKLFAIPSVVRYAALAALIVLIGVSIYLYNYSGAGDSARNQIITFAAVRSSSSATVDLSVGGDLQLRFYISQPPIQTEYALYIVGPDGQAVYRRTPYADVDSIGFGQIEIATSLMKPGIYRLIVRSAADSSLPPLREYAFRAR